MGGIKIFTNQQIYIILGIFIVASVPLLYQIYKLNEENKQLLYDNCDLQDENIVLNQTLDKCGIIVEIDYDADDLEWTIETNDSLREVIDSCCDIEDYKYEKCYDGNKSECIECCSLGVMFGNMCETELNKLKNMEVID